MSIGFLATFSATSAVTLGVALVGAVLGIINTWHQISRTRVRLRVTPKAVTQRGRDFVVGNRAEGHPDNQLCIEVINLSTFAVTVSEIGFIFADTRDRGVLSPMFQDGSTQWPRRLEPRQSMAAYSQPGAMSLERLAQVKAAYAETECEHRRYGSSPALRRITAVACASLPAEAARSPVPG